MVSEDGLNEPPPPAIDMLAVPVGTQLGCGLGEGLGLGEELGPGEGLGLGDALGPGDGLGDGLALGEGLGLGLWASVAVAPTLRKMTPRVRTSQWIQRSCFTRRVSGERLDCAAWS
jgi:hypothetical protein